MKLPSRWRLLDVRNIYRKIARESVLLVRLSDTGMLKASLEAGVPL